MINENLIHRLKPNNSLPYFIAITDIKQSSECNQDTLTLTFHEINKNLYDIEKTANVTEKILSISSNLDIDTNGLYKTKLIGFESSNKKMVDCNECIFCDTKTAQSKCLKNNSNIFSLLNKIFCDDFTPITPTPLSSHYIEIIQRPISKEFRLNFSVPYTDIPSVIVNIDDKYKYLYKSIKYSYEKNKDNKYVGVIVIFENLKRKKEYPEIKITIIGDVKSTGASSNESSTSNSESG